MGAFYIKSVSGYTLTYDTNNHTVDILIGSKRWRQSQQLKSNIIVEVEGKEYELYLEDAGSITTKEYENGVVKGIKTSYSGFEIEGCRINLLIETNICVDKSDGQLYMECLPLYENDADIKSLQWPLPFEWEIKNDKAYTVLPMMQGCLIPSNWDQKVELMKPYSYYERAAYMPWWGQVDGDTGYIAIAMTPWDGGYTLEHPAGGPTVVRALWYSSFGKLTYTRKLQFIFVGENCDYNKLCKIYRDTIKHKGNLITLKEKQVKNQKLEELTKCSIVHHCIYKHVEPTSAYYDHENLEENDKLVAFKETEEKLKHLKKLGVDHIYLHLDGWGKRGYDNLHPDVFPPCAAAGGFKGLKELDKTCEDLGYLLGIHDQYRDYYKDAETFDLKNVMYRKDCSYFTESTWFGGEQAVLCTQLAPGYVKRNYNTFKANNIALKGTYLDVFSVIQLDECFHKEHPMTRKECMEKRIECFEYVRAEGLLASSEELCDWAIPHMDLCHHAPHALDGGFEAGKGSGIPVPLTSLVYGDCIVVPWANTKGGWGIPEGNSGYLYALLTGGVGYLDIDANEVQIQKNKIVSNHYQNIAYYERVKHEFVEGNYQKQKMYFSNGTIVTVDFDTDAYCIRMQDKVIQGKM
ncbi:MAG: DUF5696 domain-containing protein [Cellulosilyticaceae bacterium]